MASASMEPRTYFETCCFAVAVNLLSVFTTKKRGGGRRAAVIVLNYSYSAPRTPGLSKQMFGGEIARSIASACVPMIVHELTCSCCCSHYLH